MRLLTKLYRWLFPPDEPLFTIRRCYCGGWIVETEHWEVERDCAIEAIAAALKAEREERERA